MKNTAKNKGQVLAALALAFVLGVMAMPGAAFAEENAANDDVAEEVLAEVTSENNVVADEESNTGETEGDEGGISPLAEGSEVSGGTNAEGDGAGDAEGETKDEVSEDVAENLAELYGRIQTNESFAGYRKAEKLVGYVVSLTTATSMNDEQRAAAVEGLRAEVAELLPTMTGVDKMSEKELIEAAKTLPNFEAYAELWLTVAFVVDDGTLTDFTAEYLKSKYNEATLMLFYSALANAAVAIDDTVMDGLMAYELPKTSAPEVETPNTGANDGLVEGSLDLAMVTLVASAALATLAGAGVLARLYLHRKF